MYRRIVRGWYWSINLSVQMVDVDVLVLEVKEEKYAKGSVGNAQKLYLK
jgi:hypothetical protein